MKTPNKIGSSRTPGDNLCDKRLRKTRKRFLTEINQLIEWQPLGELIASRLPERKHSAGAPSYAPIILLKMLMLETWYDLSDCELESRINDSLAFSHFLGLHVEDLSPDHSTLSRFRTTLSKLGLLEELYTRIDAQLAECGVTVRKGVMVDAKIVEMPCILANAEEEEDEFELGNTSCYSAQIGD